MGLSPAGAEGKAAGLWPALPALLLGGLLLLGLALRVGRPDLVAFKLDEAKFVGIVDAAARGEWPAAGGMASWGGVHPPLRAYLLAPVRWLTDQVVALPAWLGLLSWLNLAAIGLVAGRFGWRAAVGAVALAAASPWGLHFARALWDAPLPVFGTLALGAALIAAGDAGARDDLSPAGARRLQELAAFAVGPLLALHALTHLTAWFTLPLAPYLWLRFARFRTRAFLVGCMLGVVLLAPYTALLLTGPEPLGQVLAHRAGGAGPDPGRVLIFALWYVSGADLQALLGVAHAAEFPFSGLLALGPWLAAPLLLLGAWVCATWRGPSSPPLELEAGPGERIASPAPEIGLAWAAIPLVITALLPGEPLLHYLQVWGGGAPFVLMGVGLAWAWEQVRPGRAARWPGLGALARAVAVAAVLAVPLVQAAAWVSLLSFFERFPDTALGPTLGAWEALAQPARAANPGQRLVTVWTSGDQPAYQDRPAVLQRLLAPRVEPLFASRDSLVVTEGTPNVAITTPPRGEPRWGFHPIPGLQAIVSTPAGTVWEFPAPPVGGDLAAAANPLPAGRVAFADGLALEGWDWRSRPGEGREIELVTFWRVDEPSARALAMDLTLFVHLEDEAGRRVGQEDGFLLPSGRWRAGLRVAQVTVLAAGELAGPGWVRLGVYSRKDLQRSLRLDDGSDSVRLGPIQPGAKSADRLGERGQAVGART